MIWRQVLASGAKIVRCRNHCPPYVHLVYSTKERRPFLKDETIRVSTHRYLGGISKKLGCAPIIVGGVEDHVHLLARLGRTITQAEWIKELKRVSNLWLKKEHQIRQFEWQRGYAAFSVSQSDLKKCRIRSPTRLSIIRKLIFRMN